MHDTSTTGPDSLGNITVIDPPVVVQAPLVINYGDFAHGPNTQQLALNGSAATVDSNPNNSAAPIGNVLQLTDGFPNEAGSAYFPSELSTTESFDTQFQFDLHGGTSNTQGEGITFTLQGDGTNALGGPGTDLGYGGNEAGGSGNGIPNSLAVGFQTASNTVDVFTEGSVEANTPETPSFSLLNEPVNVWIDYNSTTDVLSVYVSQSTTKPQTPLLTDTISGGLNSVIGSDAAIAGFTGGTDANSAVQEIDSWQLTQPIIFANEGQPTTSVLATFTDPGNTDNNNTVTGVSNLVGGTGYTSAPTVVFDMGGTSGGTGATATATVSGGMVTGVTITNGGSGYEFVPSITFVGGGGSGASATATTAQLFDEPLTDYTVNVTWGDGSSNSSTDGTGNVVVSEPDANGIYTVTGTHTYFEAGNYTAAVAVTHEETATQTTDDSVIVADVPLTNVTAAGPETVTEGSTTPILIGTFQDAGNPVNASNPNNPASGTTQTVGEYTADINFGDGGGLQTNNPITVISDGGDTFSVYAVHVYEYSASSPSGYTLTATIHHDNTPDASGQPISDAITVTDPVLVASNGNNFGGVEGSESNLAILATFNDPGNPTGTAENPADYLATVSWGDTSSNTSADGSNSVIIVALGNGNYAVEGTHLYTGEGTFTVTTTIQESDNAATLSNTATVTAVISDAQILDVSGVLNVPASVQEGTAIGPTAPIATFVDPAGLGTETPADYSATINWGDGTTSSGTIKFDATVAAGAAWEVDCADPYVPRSEQLYHHGHHPARPPGADYHDPIHHRRH